MTIEVGDVAAWMCALGRGRALLCVHRVTASDWLLPVRVGLPNDGDCRYLTLADVLGEWPLLLHKLSSAGGSRSAAASGERRLPAAAKWDEKTIRAAELPTHRRHPLLRIGGRKTVVRKIGPDSQAFMIVRAINPSDMAMCHLSKVRRGPFPKNLYPPPVGMTRYRAMGKIGKKKKTK